MSANAIANVPDAARRMEELGRIILAYSEVTERLQKSHDQLNRTEVTLEISSQTQARGGDFNLDVGVAP